MGRDEGGGEFGTAGCTTGGGAMEGSGTAGKTSGLATAGAE